MSEPKFTPGPWRHAGRTGGWDGVTAANGTDICHLEYNNPANASLIAAAPEMYAALSAASGFLLNAKIDLETGAKKATAINTIDGGLRVVQAALAKARGEQ